MPSLNKHRQIGNKKGSVNVISDNRLLNENESQNSNSYGQLPRTDVKGQPQSNIRDHRGSVPVGAPRIISRVRGDKVMQPYKGQGSTP